MESTNQVVPVKVGDGREVMCRAWEGRTERGVAFVAYVALVQVASGEPQDEFQNALHEQPSPKAQRAIDMRHII